MVASLITNYWRAKFRPILCNNRQETQAITPRKAQYVAQFRFGRSAMRGHCDGARVSFLRDVSAVSRHCELSRSAGNFRRRAILRFKWLFDRANSAKKRGSQ